MQNVEALINLWWFFPLSILVTLIALKKMPITLRKGLIVSMTGLAVILESVVVAFLIKSELILFLFMSLSYFVKLFMLKEIMNGIWKNSFKKLVKENLGKYLEVSILVPPVFIGNLVLFKFLPKIVEKK